MLEQHIGPLKDLIWLELGVEVSGAINPLESRRGLSFWFENYNRSEGPVFSIRPTGLKRHHISVKFGTYADSCIEHINNRITEDSLITANALIEQIAENYDVKVNDNLYSGDLSFTKGFHLKVTLPSIQAEFGKKFNESAIKVMLPLIAVFVELIGYESNVLASEEIEVEGKISQSLIKKRERSSANRVLCLSIHGEKCGVCGFEPDTKYGAIPSSIIEVHHIEPLSEIDTPKKYDPRTDLIPVCPNCHSAIHKRRPAYLPEELKELIQNDTPT